MGRARKPYGLTACQSRRQQVDLASPFKEASGENSNREPSLGITSNPLVLKSVQRVISRSFDGVVRPGYSPVCAP